MSPSSKTTRTRAGHSADQTEQQNNPRREPRSKANPPTGRRSDSPDFVTLPERLGYTAARDLHEKLRKTGRAGLVIDGGAVTTAGALAAQVLVAAMRRRRAADESLALTMSQSMRDDLENLGVLRELLTGEAG